MTVEEILEKWAEQTGATVSRAEEEFILQMRTLHRAGVGYGWMRQVIGWEWQHNDPAGAITDNVVSRLATKDERERVAALEAGLKRICNIDDVRFMSSGTGRKVNLIAHSALAGNTAALDAALAQARREGAAES